MTGWLSGGVLDPRGRVDGLSKQPSYTYWSNQLLLSPTYQQWNGSSSTTKSFMGQTLVVLSTGTPQPLGRSAGRAWHRATEGAQGQPALAAHK